MASDFETITGIGIQCAQAGKNQEALDWFSKGIALNPKSAHAHLYLANAYSALGNYPAALKSYNKAIDLDPHFVEAYNNLGLLLIQQQDYRNALIYFAQAIRVDAHFSEAYLNQGFALFALAEYDAALQSYEKAVHLQPNNALAYNNLGNTYKALEKPLEALQCYEKALQINPGLADPWYNRGILLGDMGQEQEGALSCDKALAINPNLARAKWARTFLQIPQIEGFGANLKIAREQFTASLHALDAWFAAPESHATAPLGVGVGPDVVGSFQPFYLAYQAENNRELMSTYGQLCRRLMANWEQSQGYQAREFAVRGRIRLGIVTHYLCDHPVWNAFLRGLAHHLKRSEFELIFFYLGQVHDQETQLARSLATSFIEGKTAVADWAETILAQQVEVLIYPDVGMDQMTTKLASLRLAPLQLVMWGHPETTGLPTMDYFISAQCFENAASPNNYSEQLLALSNLGCCYERLSVNPTEVNLAHFGINTKLPILLCPGSIFKYAAQFDWVLVEIARRLGPCQLVFFVANSKANLTARFEARLTQAFAKEQLKLSDFVVFVPWLERPDFFSLMQQADVFLDTLGFSGFNTAMQAIECDLPIVTLAGEFMRGRLAAGILQRINLPELITHSAEEYIALAVRLAQDSVYRTNIVAQIQANRDILFDDVLPIRELEAFLSAHCRS
ncbi:tetratricopeptide repeat protein [Polynucleobacter sp. IMCC30063]|uniref:O-linked N-acetylglucosamine transferase, SPINDLY family protein n=1 Tax=Polynucleobacter sp. IMCC30063 TaxID=2907298 RepID=UPI001F468F8C|nr:glycosyltransferase family 41 protein [Polynucleobacter sp. IMCC30063]MCE7505009.1 tetratricopeptide repeat protein [Polynucleobacter sp. IMCC30063]